jgi:hypothetical protein
VPQVSPGNVSKALQVVFTASPDEPVNNDWLKRRGIGQSRQVSSMLRFLGLLAGSDCIDGTLAGCRNDCERSVAQLRAHVVDGYFRAGCGSRESLGFLGRDKLTKEELRGRVADLPPFARLAEKSRRNAIDCLWALHRLLVDRSWLERQIEEIRTGSFEAVGWSAQSGEAPQSSGPQGGTAEQRVFQARIPGAAFATDPSADQDAGLSPVAREVLRHLSSGLPVPDAAAGDRELKVLVAYDERKQPVFAHINFTAPVKRGYLAKLGWKLQAMDEND